jgi:branched-chain amino acid transport system substrate-binding protein
VGGEKFVSDYKAKFNVEPGTYATLCYDTIYLLKKAVETANSTETDKVRDVVQNIEYQGLSGLIKFSPERELAVSNFIILQIKDGAFALVTL